MSVESTTVISGLTASWPQDLDDLDEGAAHIRLIKAVLAASFPSMGGRLFRVQAKGGAYTAVLADNYSVIYATGTPWVLTLTAPGTVGNGYVLFARNDGTEPLALTPASGSINGAASVGLDTGESAVIYCNGTNYFAMLIGQRNADIAAVPEQGRFSYVSATQAKLNPFKGNKLAVKLASGQWVLRTIGSSGIAINTTDSVWGGGAIANNTTYYIYAYDSSGSLVLEGSTTAYATDSSTGLEVKSGDATRRLVGMVRSNGSGQFSYSLTPAADNEAYIDVISRLNRRPLVASTTRSGSLARSATSITEISSTLAINFLTWGDELIRASAQFRASNNTAGEVNTVYPYLDGAAAGPAAQMQAAAAGYEQTLPMRVSTLLTEGYREFSPYYVVSGGTATLHAQDDKCVQVEVIG